MGRCSQYLNNVSLVEVVFLEARRVRAFHFRRRSISSVSGHMHQLVSLVMRVFGVGLYSQGVRLTPTFMMQLYNLNARFLRN